MSLFAKMASKFAFSMKGVTGMSQKVLTKSIAKTLQLLLNLAGVAENVRMFAIATIVIAIIAVWCYIIYLMITVAYPRIYVPTWYVFTETYVYSWIKDMNNLMEMLKSVVKDAELCAASKWWVETLNIKEVINSYISLKSITEQSDYFFRQNIGAYVRLIDNLRDLEAQVKAQHDGQSKAPRFGEDACLSNIISNLLLINATTRDAVYSFAKQFENFRDMVAKCAKSCDIIQYNISDIWNGNTDNTGMFADLIEKYSKASPDDILIDQIDRLQRAIIAVQEINVKCGAEIDEMRDFYKKRRRLTQEGSDPTLRKGSMGSLMTLVTRAPISLFLESVGYALQTYFWKGVVHKWTEDKSCSQQAFFKTFNLDYAKKVWLSIVSIPLKKYDKIFRKRSLVAEHFSDPFSTLVKFFRDAGRFIKNFFWYIAFFLTHWDVTFEMILCFFLASIVWILLAIISLPGIQYVAWGIVWCIPVLTKTMYDMWFLALYSVKGAVLAILEFVVRYLSGGTWSVEFLWGGSECHSQLGKWHAISTDNAFVTPPTGCMLPCRLGFSSTNAYDMLCSKNPKWKPSLCPQQQIYRLFKKIGKIGTVASLKADPLTTIGNIPNADATFIKQEFKAQDERVSFVRECASTDVFKPYTALTRAICGNNNALQNPQIMELCDSFYCSCDANIKGNEFLCKKARGVINDTLKKTNDPIHVLWVIFYMLTLCFIIVTTVWTLFAGHM